MQLRLGNPPRGEMPVDFLAKPLLMGMTAAFEADFDRFERVDAMGQFRSRSGWPPTAIMKKDSFVPGMSGAIGLEP
jgi:hypothetical protein